MPRALWGFGRGVRLDEVGSRRRPVALRRGMGVGDGLNERSGRCWTGLAVRLRADLSMRRKPGLRWSRASQNSERQWAGGSVVTAS